MANTVGSQEMTCYFPCVWPHHGIRLSESSVCIPRAQPLLACNALPCLVSESADLSELDSSSVRVLPFHSSPAPASAAFLHKPYQVLGASVRAGHTDTISFLLFQAHSKFIFLITT